MTDNYFAVAILLLCISFVLIDGWMIRTAIIACIALGLLSGYGLLPEWQG